MSADFEPLRLALRAILRTATGYPGDDKVQWENRPFDPATAAGGLWLRENLVTGSERKTSTGFQECLGLYYIFVSGPAGRGTEPVVALAKAIADVFPPTTHLSGLRTHLYRTERQAARSEGQGQSGTTDPIWYCVPVIVYWRLFAVA